MKKEVDTTRTAPKTNRKFIETDPRPQTHKLLTIHSPGLSQTLSCRMLMECCVFKIK